VKIDEDGGVSGAGRNGGGKRRLSSREGKHEGRGPGRRRADEKGMKIWGSVKTGLATKRRGGSDSER